MSRIGIALKRKRDNAGPEDKPRKRRVAAEAEGPTGELERLEGRIKEDQARNFRDLETILQKFDLVHPDSKINLQLGVSLCKIFSRLVASGALSNKSIDGQKTQEVSEWYLRQYNNYRRTLATLLESVQPPSRLPLVHLCWKVLELDAELFDNAVWDQQSIFRPFLSTITNVSDGADVQEFYVTEYMNQCHDCCYYSLEYISYVNASHFYSMPLF
jgi:U3 small nucleolar RNA-associated protein 19